MAPGGEIDVVLSGVRAFSVRNARLAQQNLVRIQPFLVEFADGLDCLSRGYSTAGSSSQGEGGKMKYKHVLAVVAIVSGVTLLAPSSAGADAFSPKVKLQGTISCSGTLGLVKTNYGKVRWAWVEGSNGERGWATRTGDMNSSKQGYYFQFNNVPSGAGISVRVDFGCGATEASQTKFTTTFGLNRPKVGGTQTRNICAGKLIACF